MSNALSNPYEITCGGVVCKCTPFGSGSFISSLDLEKVKDEAKFKKVLFEEYEVEQSRELDGIKVLHKKQSKEKKNG